MSFVSGRSLSDVVFCGFGREVESLQFGFFLRYEAKFFSKRYLLFECRNVITASASKCLLFLFGAMIWVL